MKKYIILNTVVFLGDTPPRGMCSKTLWRRCKPKIAEDDTGPQATDLFKKMNDECMHYNILQVSGSHKVGMMIETFETIQQDIGAHKALKVYDMQYGINFDTVIKEIVGAIREQLKKTDDYINSEKSMAPKGSYTVDKCVLKLR